jgi:hypothetical protein
MALTAAGRCPASDDTRLQIFADRLPAQRFSPGKQLAFVQKIPARDFGDSEDHVPVRNGLDDVCEKPLTETLHALLVAGWAKVVSFARKGQQVLLAALVAADPGRNRFPPPGIQIPLDYLP